MQELKILMEKLSILAEYYIGIKDQVLAKDALMKELKQLYRNNREVFTDSVLHNINEIKNNFSFKFPRTPFYETRGEKLKSGIVVFHKLKYYVGVIDDCATQPESFEMPSNSAQYRVFVRPDKVLIAAAENLKIIGESRTDRCWKCGNEVQAFYCKTCPACFWFVCRNCGSCDCGRKRPSP